MFISKSLSRYSPLFICSILKHYGGICLIFFFFASSMIADYHLITQRERPLHDIHLNELQTENIS